MCQEPQNQSPTPRQPLSMQSSSETQTCYSICCERSVAVERKRERKRAVGSLPSNRVVWTRDADSDRGPGHASGRLGEVWQWKAGTWNARNNPALLPANRNSPLKKHPSKSPETCCLACVCCPPLPNRLLKTTSGAEYRREGARASTDAEAQASICSSFSPVWQARPSLAMQQYHKRNANQRAASLLSICGCWLASLSLHTSTGLLRLQHAGESIRTAMSELRRT
ncbi:uncharacterized protein BDZ83DRAFT_302751 [Colletotrichum acutatum]|uniref:Uncharacterized protein n=1 Tax=Glomerella acutata TaxID=27357 RepID=A0AAD8ULD2_GLOAC|nr:uncharacterized protein BDZ83DRAFT_302751 [Colletotrichum acutatum]KAK1725463.1 hypothetical protein BDZ83DRAFT_302751 [Colletotrichum acutatum]